MIKKYAKSLIRPAWSRLRTRIQSVVDERGTTDGQALQDLNRRVERMEGSYFNGPWQGINEKLATIEQALAAQIEHVQNIRRSTYVPDPVANQSASTSPFMQVANCQASDFYHPRYAQVCKLIAHRPFFHRKQWEWVYVIHQLLEADVLRSGSRGLGFGVGTEPLPAAFASMGAEITATDAPMDLGNADAWHATKQHSGDVSQLLHPEVAPDDLVRAKVSHRPCDMNNIDPSLVDYDFNWSSCCFEHLGSIELGLQFVVNAVEKTLKIGGVAVHTTEFNASSNDATVETGGTVIFRLRDMQELVTRLTARGHEVKPFIIGPTAHALDYHVDVPPYKEDVHLKLLLAGYVTTSVGLVVRRGR